MARARDPNGADNIPAQSQAPISHGRLMAERSNPPDSDAGAPGLSHERGNGSFFGRRKGHPLRDHQAQLMQTLLPHLAVTIDDAPTDLRALFGDDINDLRIEIGFGGGEHLVAQALAHPRTGFIGVEPYINGMAKILVLIEKHNIANIRLFTGDAAQLLAWLPEASFARIDLIHPDPWPKRKHWKRRFVQPTNIAAIARCLATQGEFRFVSDIADYNAWTLAHVLRSNLFDWTAEKADDWRAPWPGFTPTRYGQKAVREGRVANYFIFRKAI